jgi:4-hydroxy-tetrahydrodipicolinate reductase
LNVLVLGKGKTGSLVAEMARSRGHNVTSVDEFDNVEGAALTPEKLAGIDVAIDFTAPSAVMGNIQACARAGKNLVVGTTGWYSEIPAIKKLVDENGIGFLYSSNFSVGVNLFFEIAKTAAAALHHGYRGQIGERHHVHKKDAPSGTAVVLQDVIKETSGCELKVTSVREGETVGMHFVVLDSENDTIMLTHDAKSRRGFAEGAVQAAEWIAGKKGFYDFKHVFREMKP